MNPRFSVGSVLATSGRIWLRNLPRFVAITVLLYIPVIAWFLVMESWALEWLYFDLVSMLPPLLREVPSGRFLLQAVTAAAITHGVCVALTGERATIGRSLKAAMRRFFPLAGVALVIHLVQRITLGATIELVWSWLHELAAYPMTAVAVILQFPFFLAIPVATAERRGVVGSIVRGVRLSRGARLRVLAIVAIVLIGTWGSYQIAQLAILPDRSGDPDAYRAAVLRYGFVLSGIYVLGFSLGAVISAVTYRLLRDDKEGPGTEELATVFE